MDDNCGRVGGNVWDIQAFVMYCVNGTSSSSLLIELYDTALFGKQQSLLFWFHKLKKKMFFSFFYSVFCQRLFFVVLLVKHCFTLKKNFFQGTYLPMNICLHAKISSSVVFTVLAVQLFNEIKRMFYFPHVMSKIHLFFGKICYFLYVFRHLYQ